MSNLLVSDLNESYLIDLNDSETAAVLGGDSIFAALNQAFGIGSVDDSLITLNVFDVQ